MRSTVLLILALASWATAHHAAFTTGMYCKNGAKLEDDQDTNTVVNPLYDLPKSQWWMQADRNCDKFPPVNGESLALPAGGSFTAELAINRAFTTLSWNGERTTEWTDGLNHPQDWHSPSPDTCLGDNPDGAGGALHTHNYTTTAGTAWAISYQSDISKVTIDNLAVFSVLEHTPWKRLTTYQVPADLPSCPEGGCYCAWLWVPIGCGQPNMYMQNFRCHVTGSTSTKKVAPAKAPVYCADDASKCVKGAKQMVAWNQLDGNNVVVPQGATPAYNQVMGFKTGPQNDIFL